MLNNILLSVKPKPAALLVPLALLSLVLNGLTTSPSRIEISSHPTTLPVVDIADQHEIENPAAARIKEIFAIA